LCVKVNLFFLILYRQVEAEKPSPTIFLKSCEFVDVKPEETMHVGDDS
jgi:HAD superfamily hydrolase (TIGR01549 family)